MLPSKEELEEELDQKRLEARERLKHSDSFSRSAAPVIFVGVVFWGAMYFVVLYSFSEWQRLATISAIIGVLIAIALIALRINANKGRPFSRYTIFNALLIAILATLILLARVRVDQPV